MAPSDSLEEVFHAHFGTLTSSIGGLLVASLMTAGTAAETHDPQISGPLFDAAGALVSRPLNLAPNPPIDGPGADQLDPWNLWTLVNDAHCDGYQSPDLIRDTGDVLHCAFVAFEGYALLKLLYARSTNHNESWTDPNLIAAQSTGNLNIMLPDSARAAGDDIWIAYAQYRAVGGGTEIRLVKSSTAGQTFGPPVVVDDGSPSGVYDLVPSALSVENTIYVAWHQNMSFTYRIRFNRSVDGGETWLPADVVVDDSQPAEEFTYGSPVLGYDPAIERLYVCWATSSGKVVVASSDDQGSSWNGAIEASDPAAHLPSAADMCIGSDGRLYVVWGDFRSQEDTDVYFTWSDDDGATWTTPALKVNDNIMSGNQYEPHLALGPNGDLHIGFIHNIPGNLDVNLYYTRSSDDGLTWESPNSRVNDVPDMVAPRMPGTFAVSGAQNGSAYVAWRDMRRLSDVYCASNLVPAAIDDADAPPQVKLEILPIPARGHLSARISSLGVEPTSVQIYDVRGRVLRRDVLAAGSAVRTWEWDGRDDEGRLAAPATYFVRVAQGSHLVTRTVVWLP